MAPTDKVIQAPKPGPKARKGLLKRLFDTA